jgi:hypothetical protein
MKTPPLDFGQIASGLVVDDASGQVKVLTPRRHVAGEIVGLRPRDPRIAEVHTPDGEYVLIAVNR